MKRRIARTREVFEFRFPAGILVRDTIEGKSYRVDAAGKSMGAVLDLPPLFPPQAAGRTGSETLQESKSWTPFVLPSSLCILGLAGILWAVRRWRTAGRLDT
jgi:hypothetical protein